MLLGVDFEGEWDKASGGKFVRNENWAGDFNGETWPDRIGRIVFRAGDDPETVRELVRPVGQLARAVLGLSSAVRELTRAVLEGVAFGLRDSHQALKETLAETLTERTDVQIVDSAGAADVIVRPSLLNLKATVAIK